jgi:hypothetical protein
VSHKIRRYRIEYRDHETGELRETIDHAFCRVDVIQQFFAGDPGLKRQYLWCSEIE